MAFKITVHFKILNEPTVPLDEMLVAMREVYEPAGFSVEEGATESLNTPLLSDLEAGDCLMGGELTSEQTELFRLRSGAGPTDLVIYFVRTTVPPYNGCAAHPDGAPGAVVAGVATRWTLGHEVGHVLGLQHVDDNRRLMTGGGTSKIVPPATLSEEEVEKMRRSRYVIEE